MRAKMGKGAAKPAATVRRRGKLAKRSQHGDAVDRNAPVEVHPLEPFVTQHTRVILCGSFMPLRRSILFFYPNPSNDMWAILGMIFFGTRDHFFVPGVSKASAPKTSKTVPRRLDEVKIRHFMETAPVGFCDVAKRIRRTRGLASDDNIEIVESRDVLRDVLPRAPNCEAIIATGTLALTHLLQEFRTYNDEMTDKPPVLFSVGGHVVCTYTPPCSTAPRQLHVYRAPSTSRAYPRPFAEKAAMYRSMLAAHCTIPLLPPLMGA